MEDHPNRQTQCSDLLKNLLVSTSRIDHNGLPRHWISEDRAIAAKRWYRKRFTDQFYHHDMLS